MRKLMKTAGLVVLAALCLVLLVTVVGRLAGGENVATRVFQSLMAPAEKLVSRGIRELETLYGYLHDYDQLKAENAALKTRIAQMEQAVRDSQGANEENERLRSLLGFARAHTEFDLADATLISWSASNWNAAFSIDQGSRAGIATGDCVITENGFLVGLVTETGLYTATVRCLTDPAAAIGARLQNAGLSAVAEGDFALMGQGRLKLSYVPDGGALQLDDTVLTSGAGGVYPAGLVIGRVTDTMADDSGFSEYGVVTPAADLTALRQVFVIRGSGSEDGHAD